MEVILKPPKLGNTWRWRVLATNMVMGVIFRSKQVQRSVVGVQYHPKTSTEWNIGEAYEYLGMIICRACKFYGWRRIKSMEAFLLPRGSLQSDKPEERDI
uniref:Uncharacterized protein n=1 Tax=Cuerna arida TaxID=1464854 RepID=A0A1B6FBR6_9HEMI